MGGYPENWSELRQQVYKRDIWACRTCGRKGGPRGDAELHCHHILPKSEGGSHELENLTTLCDRCHAEVHDDARLRAKHSADGSALAGHLKIGILAGWWTAGLTNLVYEYRRRVKNKRRKNALTGLKKEADKRSTGRSANHVRTKWHKQVDAKYNAEFGGCPSCGTDSLYVSWRSKGDAKVKVIQCGDCQSLFEEVPHRDSGNEDITLEPVDGIAEIAGVDSAFEQELNRYIRQNPGVDLDELKRELLGKADSLDEMKLIESKIEGQRESANSSIDVDPDDAVVQNTEKSEESGENPLHSSFRVAAQEFDEFPKQGTRSENGGVPSLPTLVHYGLKAALDEDLTGVIKSQTKAFLAASCAAIRGETAAEAQRYLEQPKGDENGLQGELEQAFGDVLDPGTRSTPIDVGSSLTGGGMRGRDSPGLAACVCAVLSTQHGIDPEQATEKALG